jgi:hypothetical protein
VEGNPGFPVDMPCFYSHTGGDSLVDWQTVNPFLWNEL